MTDPANDVPEVRPLAVYTLDSAAALLGLAPTCLPRAVRAGQLRVSRRGGRYFVLGKWLIEWLEGGTRTRRRPVPSESD